MDNSVRCHGLRLHLLLAIAVIAAACGERSMGAGREVPGVAMPPPCTAEALHERTSGVREFTSLGAGARPQLAAAHGATLFITMFTPCAAAHEIVLWEIDTRTRSAYATPLGITTAGLWHALDVADDGTAWVGTRELVVHVRPDRTIERFVLPPPGSAVPRDFVSRAGSGSAAGAITAIAATGQMVFFGRAGHHEVTTLDTTTHGFGSIALPRPFGEVKSLSTVGAAQVAFSATRAITDPLGAHDAVGILDVHSGVIAPLSLRPGVLTAGGDQVAYASWTPSASGISSELGVIAPAGPRWAADAGRYDATAFAVRADGALAVRLGGTAAEVAFLDPRGREVRRVPFAAVQPSSQSVPALAFAIFGPGDALWFAVRGRPELYRIP